MGHFALQSEVSGSRSWCSNMFSRTHREWQLHALSAHGGGGGGGRWWWLEARNTGSHCGRHATGWLLDCLFILLGAVVSEMRSAQKTEAKPMRTSARKLNPPLIACSLRKGVYRGG